MFNKIFVFIFTFLLFLNAVFGQVNTETLNNVHNDSFFVSSANISFNHLSGNSNLNQINLGGAVILGSLVQGQKGVTCIRYITHVNMTKTSVKGKQVQDEKFMHLRLIKMFDTKSTSSWAHEYFYQYQDNEVNKIKLRSLFGANIRKYFLLEKSRSTSVGFGTFHESEDVSYGVSSNIFRTNFYFSSNLGESYNNLAATLYVQNSFSDFKDVRILFETSFTFPLLKRENDFSSLLDAQLSFVKKYDSMPALEINKHDTVFLVKLVGSFRIN